jgi:predicted peptidase
MNVALGVLERVLADYPTDPDRVYLTGLSMGGYGSWDLAERMPERFAAVAPVCGGGDTSRADRLVKLPIWAWHGDQDPAVPVARSREMIAAIEKAGGHPKYTELPGVAHNSWIQAYGNADGLIPWMFAQARTGQR